MSFSVHATNRANNIYVMGTGLTQGIHDTMLYAEKNFYRNVTDFYKIKTDQLVQEKLCIGNLSDQWTTSESEKTGIYGKIYDFVVGYEQIAVATKILDMHKYLMTKHKISP